ncbi:MAG: ribonuclease III [Rickettsiaceae bacterium]
MKKIQITDDQLDELEKSIEYKFQNRKFLIEALSHPSLKRKYKNDPNYERFELLGDSLLNFIITEALFEQIQDCQEGELAKMRAHLVCKEAISQIASNINLHKYIIMTIAEDNMGGRQNKNNLENAMEALIAGIYLDGGIYNAKIVIMRLWSDFMINHDFSLMDAKTILQEWSQKAYGKIPEYKLIKSEGPAHAPKFTISVEIKNFNAKGCGKSIKDAEKDAAIQLIKKLKIKTHND